MNKQQLIKPRKPRFEADPKLREAELELGKLLSQFMGAPITETMIAQVEDLIAEFKAHMLFQGVVMPRMRVVAMPLAGFLQIWPAEMEKKDFDIRIVGLVKSLRAEGRNFDPEELAKAIRRAYPEYTSSLSRLNVLNN